MGNIPRSFDPYFVGHTRWTFSIHWHKTRSSDSATFCIAYDPKDVGSRWNYACPVRRASLSLNYTRWWVPMRNRVDRKDQHYSPGRELIKSNWTSRESRNFRLMDYRSASGWAKSKAIHSLWIENDTWYAQKLVATYFVQTLASLLGSRLSLFQFFSTENLNSTAQPASCDVSSNDSLARAFSDSSSDSVWLFLCPLSHITGRELSTTAKLLTFAKFTPRCSPW